MKRSGKLELLVHVPLRSADIPRLLLPIDVDLSCLGICFGPKDAY